MVNVAIAGGFGNFGRTVTEVLHREGKHKVFVLGRKAPDDQNPEIQFIAVDYNDVKQIQAILQDNAMHVVISCLSLTGDNALAAETNLIRAADSSPVTKRFITSNWGTPVMSEMMDYMPWLKYKLAAIKELKSTKLEWTHFIVGYFLDYYGMPNVKTHLPSFLVSVDVANKIARIPGTGNEPVTFTYTFDVAKFVAVALDLDKWEEETIVAGDKATWNDFLKLAEKYRGSKFDVDYDSLEILKDSKLTELPSHTSSYGLYPKETMQFLMAGLERAMVAGMLDLPHEKALNRLYPDIKMITIEEMLRDNWKSG